LLDSTETSSGLKNIQLLVNELNESQKHNKDLKRIIVNLQNQLESDSTIDVLASNGNPLKKEFSNISLIDEEIIETNV